MRSRRRRGATEQAKGSADIHGNLRIHSAVIISINAERQWQGEGRGQGGVGEFWGVGLGREGVEWKGGGEGWGACNESERGGEVESDVVLLSIMGKDDVSLTL